MSKSVLFSIIIANYNKASNVAPLLTSIFAQYPHDDFEIFFMDDASTDASVQEAQRFPLQLYQGKEQVGPATLRNMAAQKACGEYLLFMDSDVILPDGTLQRFRELCLVGGFGAVSGLEVLPPVIDNWIGWFRTLQVRDTFGEFRHREGLLGAWGSTLGGVRRELFLRLGGFNETFKGADVEDHELAIKLKSQEPMIFSPGMTYRHSYPGSMDLIRKQFRRASQMVRLKDGALMQNALLFRRRFKAGHITSAAIVVMGIATMCESRFAYPLAGIMLLKICLNHYLFREAFRAKGPVFLLYTFCMSLIMGVSIISGAGYGKLRQVLK